MENIFAGSYSTDPGRGTVQVINRKKYDTDSADLLWSKKFENHIDDFTRTEGVALLQKKNGEFFKYWCYWYKKGDFIVSSNPVITPLTEDEAKDLTEHHVPEQYIDIFGEVEE